MPVSRIILSVLLLLSFPSDSSGQSGEEVPVRRIIDKMVASYDSIQDYTCIFHKQERVDGKLLPREKIRLKFRKPFSVYMQWLAESRKGQEVLYVQGWNDNKMRAHPGSFPDITLNLNPVSAVAMRNNRHPVTEAGIGQAVSIISRDYKKAQRLNHDVRYTYHGIVKTYGVRCRHFVSIVPDRLTEEYYAPKSSIYISLETFLPIRTINRDIAGRLIEDYAYENIRINVGLTDRDFDPDNPEYDF